LTAIEHHEQPVVLVVGMRGRVHEDAGVGEMTQGEAERRMALLLVDRDDPHLRAWSDGQRCRHEHEQDESAPHGCDLTGGMRCEPRVAPKSGATPRSNVTACRGPWRGPSEPHFEA